MLSETIHLSSTIEENHQQASLKLGMEYERLLQEDNEKSVLGSSMLLIEHQKVHEDSRAYLTKSHDTTAISANRKAVTSLSSRHVRSYHFLHLDIHIKIVSMEI